MDGIILTNVNFVLGTQDYVTDMFILQEILKINKVSILNQTYRREMKMNENLGELGEWNILEDVTITAPEKKKISMYVYEFEGCEIVKVSDNSIYTKREDLKVGDYVDVGGGRGTIKEKDGELYFDCGSAHGTLEFDKDQRHCWVCSCLCNVNVFKNTNFGV